MKKPFNKIFTIIVFVLLLVTVNYSFAQNPRLDPHPNSKFKDCDLMEKNEIWWKQTVSERNEGKKIGFIQQKIISDTLYKKYNPKIKTVSDPSNYNIDEGGNLCDVKILFVLTYYKKKSLILDLLENPEYLVFLKALNPENTKIFFITPEGGTALYGIRGSSGVVFIALNDKLLENKIRKIKNK